MRQSIDSPASIERTAPPGGRASGAGRAGDERRGGDDRERRLATLALVGVVILLIGVQFVTLHITRRLNWDEAVYLSQVTPGEPAAPWHPHRARGLPLLLVPVAVFDPAFTVVRVYMAGLAGLGLFLAFRPWVRTLGFAAPVGALVFAGTWVTQYFAGEIYPNFWVGLAGLAAAGHLATYLRADPARRHLVAVAGWIMLAALLRPPDSVLIAGGLFVITLLMSRRAILPVTAALAVGGLLGVAPWFLEGYIRFGFNPWEQLLAAREGGVGDVPVNNLQVYLVNLEGPVRCGQFCKGAFMQAPHWDMSLPSIAWVGAIVAFSALALATPRRARITRAVYVAAAGAAVPLAFYLSCTCAINLRYVLAVWGLWAIVVGAGVVAAWRLAQTVPGGRIVHALLIVAVLAWGGWQTLVAEREMDNQVQPRARAPILAEILDDRAGDRPCVAAVEHAYPQISYWSDQCLTVRLRLGEDIQWPTGDYSSPYDVGALARDGYAVFALATTRPADNSPLHQWQREDISTDLLGDYTLYTPPSAEDVPLRPDG